MSSDHEFRRAIEDIKARTSLEDVVGECVDGDLVARSGRLWACCPFHDESTPSFAIGPDPGLWYCFGACRMGGDLIEFVKRRNNLSFIDAIELLAARAGVTLPQRQKGRKRGGEDAGLAVLQKAAEFYSEELQGPRGATARDYLARRQMSPEIIAAFGLGVAPSSGQALVDCARKGGGSPKPWEATGLMRARESGGFYDFFRGRLMIPIRDHRGRTVGFGGRRLQDDEQAGPKYVNTPETDWFKKGSVIYGYDRAVDSIRRSGHGILMEGYTDVLAAHQAGLTHACAVLGTATTPQHADLMRRAGVRRISLVFDGDEAGRRAAWRALEGLLPLDIELDVVRPPEGQDPADLLLGGDAQPFLAHLEQAQPWFDFITGPLASLRGRELSRAVDDVLELLSAVPKPVHRDALLGDLAGLLGLPAETLREQWRALPERRRVRAAAKASATAAGEASSRSADQRNEMSAGPAGSGNQARSEGEGSGPEGTASEAPARPVAPMEPHIKNAYLDAVGATLVDTSLIPMVQPLLAECSHPGLGAILQALCTLWDDDDAELNVDSVMTQLEDHPVRGKVAWLVQHARNAESPLTLLNGALEVLRRDAYQKRIQAARSLVAELEGEVLGGGVGFLGSEAPDDDVPTDSIDPGLLHGPEDGDQQVAPSASNDPDLIPAPPHTATPRPSLAEAVAALTKLLREGPGTQFQSPTSV